MFFMGISKTCSGYYGQKLHFFFHSHWSIILSSYPLLTATVAPFLWGLLVPTANKKIIYSYSMFYPQVFTINVFFTIDICIQKKVHLFLIEISMIIS